MTITVSSAPTSIKDTVDGPLNFSSSSHGRSVQEKNKTDEDSDDERLVIKE